MIGTTRRALDQIERVEALHYSRGRRRVIGYVRRGLRAVAVCR